LKIKKTDLNAQNAMDPSYGININVKNVVMNILLK